MTDPILSVTEHDGFLGTKNFNNNDDKVTFSFLFCFVHKLFSIPNYILINFGVLLQNIWLTPEQLLILLRWKLTLYLTTGSLLISSLQKLNHMCDQSQECTSDSSRVAMMT